MKRKETSLQNLNKMVDSTSFSGAWHLAGLCTGLDPCGPCKVRQ